MSSGPLTGLPSSPPPPPGHPTATASASTSAARRTDQARSPGAPSSGNAGAPPAPAPPHRPDPESGPPVVGDDGPARGYPRFEPALVVHGLEPHLAQLDGGVGTALAGARDRDEPTVHRQGEPLRFGVVHRGPPRVGRVPGRVLARIAHVHEDVVGELAAHLDLRDPLAEVARDLRAQE